MEYLEGGRVLFPDKAAPVLAAADFFEAPPSVHSLRFASVAPKMVYDSGVLGTHFNFGLPPRFSTGEPLEARFEAADNCVVYTTKMVGRDVYIYGITTPKLIEWAEKAPRPGPNDMVDETKLLALWKVPREEFISLKPLTDTDTTPLKAYADDLMSRILFLKNMKVRSAKQAVAYCKQGFVKNAKSVLQYAELEERRVVAEQAARGKKSAAPAGSRDAGKEVGEKWAATFTDWIHHAAPFYTEPLEDRFIIVPLDETTGQPTDETIAKIKADLE
jgi:hypothetical protein